MLSDIFLSYSQADKQKAVMLANALANKGWSVWWDHQIPVGEVWADTIEQALKGARCILVVWSAESVKSQWVKKEARYAERHGKMIPILIENVEPPFEFEHLQALNLSDWCGEESATFQVLTAGLSVRLQRDTDNPVKQILLIEEAAKFIQEHARMRRVPIGLIETSPVSPYGTNSYRATASDGKGVIYCHASGRFRGQTFYLRKGIGWFYETVVGSASSRLGLPISNEELADGTGYPTSFFEGGYIEWSPKTEVARAVVSTPEGYRTFLESKL